MNDRPIGVTILAVLHLLGGVIGLCMTPMMLSVGDKAGAALEQLGASLPVLILGVVLLVALNLAAGVGLWMGTPWGWRLATFYYVYSIARYVNALFLITQLADDFAPAQNEVEKQFIKFGIRIVIHSLILLYLFRESVLDYFEMRHVHIGRELGQQVAAVGSLFGLNLLLSWLL